MSDEARIVCGKCKVDPILTDAEGGPEAVCPSCGQSDKVDDAVRIAGEHAMHHGHAALQDSVRRAIKGNEFMKFEGKPLPKRTFRWHAV